MNASKHQWVDLGDLSDACIVQAYTCSAAGGAVAFWMRVTGSDYSIWHGIITSSGWYTIQGMNIGIQDKDTDG